MKKLWPSEISTSSGALNAVYWGIEQKFGKKFGGDQWLMVGCWAFHQTLWCISKEKSEKNQFSLCISMVDIRIFDAKMRENLSDDSWDSDRKFYGELVNTIDN
ncbi:hypothetical protein [Methylobacterium indicum]|uniref:hypothetical protein n=1 Tax=Methylobacterium indicum TaxID=1775910 RepID=UPI000F7960D1|nr:hypothetical protein [Methylobacterium indicum]